MEELLLRTCVSQPSNRRGGHSRPEVAIPLGASTTLALAGAS
jgi:hypothetical protein